MFKSISQYLLLFTLVWGSGLPEVAQAYVGPGTGLSAIGAFLALLVGIVVAVFGFLWYPLKRLLGKKSQEPEPVEESRQEQHEQS